MSERVPADPKSARPIRVIRDLHVVSAILAGALVAGAGLTPWIAIPVCFVPLHLGILWATLSPYSQWLGPVVTRFVPTGDRRELWLTLDDGPAPGETPAVLDALDRHEARATFFLIGEKAAAHPELVREILRRGHQIANHTQRHLQYAFWRLPRTRLATEIDEGAAALASVAGPGSVSALFRSPVGMKPLSLHRLLAARGLTLVGWTARGRDGVLRPDLDRVLGRLSSKAKPGAILLLHEGRGHAPEVLDRLLPRLRDEGYSFVIPSPKSFISGRR